MPAPQYLFLFGRRVSMSMAFVMLIVETLEKENLRESELRALKDKYEWI
ncbi:MAG: hypothetical protein WAK50_06025 [Nitrososphaeraceae archaeon]